MSDPPRTASDAPAPSDADILRRYPFPIAYAYRLLLEEDELGFRMKSLEHCFQTTLVYVGLLLLSDYLRSDLTDDDINRMILDCLHRPALGHWDQFVRASARAHSGEGAKPFVSELERFFHHGRKETSHGRLVRRLVEFRNDWLGHGGNWSKRQVEEVIAEHLPHLRDLLVGLRFLADYDLCWVTETRLDGETCHCKAARMMGSDFAFDEVELSLTPAVAANWPPQPNSLVLLRRRDGHCLDLFPLLIFEFCEECQRLELPGIGREAFLYQSFDEKAVEYLGPWHRKRLPENLDELAELCDRKGELAARAFAGKRLTWPILVQATSRQVQQHNASVQPMSEDLFVSRTQAQRCVRDFLQSDARAMVLLGTSGSGKSVFLASMARRLAAEEHAVLLLSGAALPPSARELEGVFKRAVCRERAPFARLLTEVDRLAQAAQRRCLIIIDAINEAGGQSESLLGAIDALITSLPPSGTIKVIISCRTTFFERLQTRGMRLPEAALYRADDGDLPRVGAFTPEELREAYQRYASTYELRTDFDNLSQASREILARPIVLSLAAKAFNGRELPRELGPSQVMDAYFQLPQLRRTAAHRVAVAEEMLTEKQDALPERRLAQNPLLGPEIENPEPHSAYVELLDAGVLQRFRSRPSPRVPMLIRFAHDSLLEYALSEVILARAPTADDFAQYASDARDFLPLWDASASALKALQDETLLASVAQRDSHETTSLAVEAIAAIGDEEPETASALANRFLHSQNAGQNRVAVLAAYRLRDLALLETAVADRRGAISLLAGAHLCFLWEQGPALMRRFMLRLADEAKRIGPVPRLGKLKALAAISGGIFADRPLDAHVRRAVTAAWRRALKALPTMTRPRSPARALLIRAAMLLVVPALKRGGTTMDYEAARDFFGKSPDERAPYMELVPYISLEPRELTPIADRLIEMSRWRDPFAYCLVMGALWMQGLAQPDNAVPLLRRMFDEGDALAKYEAARAIGHILAGQDEPNEDLLDLFNELALRFYRESDGRAEFFRNQPGPHDLPRRLIAVNARAGHLLAPALAELIQWAREQDRPDILTAIASAAGVAGRRGRPRHALAAIERLIAAADPLPEAAGDAIARALADMRIVCPAEVEAFLERIAEADEWLARMRQLPTTETAGWTGGSDTFFEEVLVHDPKLREAIVELVYRLGDAGSLAEYISAVLDKCIELIEGCADRKAGGATGDDET